MKMMVSAASKIFSAISLGVLRREALSTRWIMRSRNVSPGLAVTSTTIRSESTRVPPVTALRSPPASRMTGADSPVIADSSTEAMPSMMVPSLGIRSPASITTVSPLRSWEDDTRSSLPPTRRRAMVSVRARRSVAACAFPRPSASASAKLAKMSVNHNQSVIWPTKSESDAPRNSPAMKMIVVITEPTSTTNMTGLRACQRGSSLVTLSISAGTMMLRSSRLERRQRQDRDHFEEAPQPHRGPAQGVPEHRVPGKPGEGAAIVADLGGERIENLGEAVGAGVVRPAAICGGCRRQHRDRGEAENDQDVDQHGER